MNITDSNNNLASPTNYEGEANTIAKSDNMRQNLLVTLLGKNVKKLEKNL